MPIYEYHCSDCNSDFEKLMRFSDPQGDSPECPGCQSANTRKRLSTVASFSKASYGSATSSGCASSGPFR